MIAGYFTHIETDESYARLSKKIDDLPHAIQREISKYKNERSRALSVCGKLLLARLIKEYGLGGDTMLMQLHSEPPAKPYFNESFDFNISHSGDIAMCVISLDSGVGVDVEEIKATDINLYRDNFTVAEWATINYTENKLAAFYNMWVRKEAFLKAKGEGVQASLSSVDVCNDTIIVDGILHYLYDVSVTAGYKACVCSNKPGELNISEVDIKDLL